MSQQRHAFTEDTEVAVHGYSDLGWSVGVTPRDEDRPVPPLVCEQRAYTMAFVFTAPAGTKFVLWSGAFDRAVLP